MRAFCIVLPPLLLAFTFSLTWLGLYQIVLLLIVFAVTWYQASECAEETIMEKSSRSPMAAITDYDLVCEHCMSPIANATQPPCCLNPTPTKVRKLGTRLTGK